MLHFTKLCKEPKRNAKVFSKSLAEQSEEIRGLFEKTFVFL